MSPWFGPGTRHPVSGSASPSMANWNTNALAIIVTPMRVVCGEVSKCSASAMSLSTCGVSATALASVRLTAETVSSISSAAFCITISLVAICSHSPAKSSTDPVSHPDSGNHAALSSSPWRVTSRYRYSAPSMASGRSRWFAARNSAGADSATTCSTTRPESASTRPRRRSASCSTVRAGAYSVSITTGVPTAPPWGVTTMSGDRPAEPATTPVCSAFTSQRGCLRSNACASSPLNAFSEVRAMPRPLPCRSRRSP